MMLHRGVGVVISCFLLLTLQNGLKSLTTIPYLSSPGSTSILVFVDLHRSYQGDTCSDVDWDIYELARSLYWQSITLNNTGIEIFDTCSSTSNVINIIRRRLASETCATNQQPISGVISYSNPSINKLLSENFDQLHVVVDNGEAHSKQLEYTRGTLYVQLASTENTEILGLMLSSLNWTYITSISDNHPESLAEQSLLLRVAQKYGICIQYSQVIDQWTDSIPTLKTDGVVLFAKDLTGINDVLDRLQATSSVVVATPDRRTHYLQLLHRGFVLTDAYESDETFVSYMASSLWNDSSLDHISIQYYLTNHNCSYVNRSVSEEISCHDIEHIQAYVSTLTSTRLFNIFYRTMELMNLVSETLFKDNCTDFAKECFDFETIGMQSSFERVENDTLVSRPPYNVTVTWVHGGIIHQTEVVSVPDFNQASLDLGSFINGTNLLPASTCKTWCPSCEPSRCSQASERTMRFDGDYFFLPGDLIIVAMLPLSQRWGRTSVEVCTGIDADSNFDILAEAFLYAILSAQDRQPEFLQNMTVGALLLDTCSESNRALQTMINFESCKYNFTVSGNDWEPSPDIVPAYLIVGGDEHLTLTAKDLQKLAVHVDPTGTISTATITVVNSSAYDFNAVIEFLRHINVSYVGVLTSKAESNGTLNDLFDMSFSKNVCIAYTGLISEDNSNLLYTIRSSQANVIIIAALPTDVKAFFRSLTTSFVGKTWILMETRENWLDLSSLPLPRGSVIFSLKGKEDLPFIEHVNDLFGGKSPDLATDNPWIERFNQTRTQSTLPSVLNHVTYMQSSDVMKAVDLTLGAIEVASRILCGNKSSLCPEFFSQGPQTVLNEFSRFQEEEHHTNYIIYNLHETGFVQVGQWVNRQLTVDTDNLKSFDSIGNQLAKFRESYCFISPCSCLNANITNNQTEKLSIKQLDYEMGFKDSTAEFKKELWTIIVVIIAGTACFLTLVMMVYIMCKVCAGAHMRRHLALGILLLIAIIFLLLSVLPFVFTPSESVCGMRFFAHGLSYAFCFGIMLSKMMALRDYRYIGLGGEISRVNQLLTVFFITSVQIAIGVQWWVLRTPVVVTEDTLGVVDNELRQITYYACDFERKDFISYHSYVLVLLVLCCLYSLSVRNETKNLKEARLLLISSWFSLAVWIAIIVTFLILDRKFLEAICSIGILANSLAMIVIIYLPKVTAISRLKYDVADQNAHKENGYKLDPDFMFERPYSLPGTLHSSITDKHLTYPRSLATFDTSLSY